MFDLSPQQRQSKLYRNLMYPFDLFLRAATMIQANYRGFHSRRSSLRGQNTLKAYVAKVRLCQKQIRRFLAAKRSRYAQYADYLVQKSKKIIQQLQDFQYINSKLNKLR